MIHSALTNSLKTLRLLTGLPCILTLLLAFPVFSQDRTPDAVYSTQSHSHPPAEITAPIEIRDCIPHEDAGIIDHAGVPEETGFAVLIRSAHGIDTRAPAAVRFLIADGRHAPYVRDLNTDTVRAVILDENEDRHATFVWAAYDRFHEPFLPTGYPPGAVISITVEVQDAQNNILQPLPFEFKIESSALRAFSGQSLPQTDAFYIDERLPGDLHDAGIEILDGELYGAKVLYSSREPLTPAFGPVDGIEEIDLAGVRAAGPPLNLTPHSVFDIPVIVFIPVADDVDVAAAGLAYHDGTQWLLAADADGNVLAGGEGWLVPGSMIKHRETRPALIEVQVHHFSGVQAVVFTGGLTEDEENKDDSGTRVVIFASCFINSAAGGADVGWPIVLLGVTVVALLIFDRINRIFQDYFFILFQFTEETGKTQSACGGNLFIYLRYIIIISLNLVPFVPPFLVNRSFANHHSRLSLLPVFSNQAAVSSCSFKIRVSEKMRL